jgi:hypothetical protein
MCRVVFLQKKAYHNGHGLKHHRRITSILLQRVIFYDLNITLVCFSQITSIICLFSAVPHVTTAWSYPCVIDAIWGYCWIWFQVQSCDMFQVWQTVKHPFYRAKPYTIYHFAESIIDKKVPEYCFLQYIQHITRAVSCGTNILPLLCRTLEISDLTSSFLALFAFWPWEWSIARGKAVFEAFHSREQQT